MGTQTSAQPRGGVDWQSSPLVTSDIRSLWKIQQIDERAQENKAPLGPLPPADGRVTFWAQLLQNQAARDFFLRQKWHHILAASLG